MYNVNWNILFSLLIVYLMHILCELVGDVLLPPLGVTGWKGSPTCQSGGSSLSGRKVILSKIRFYKILCGARMSGWLLRKTKYVNFNKSKVLRKQKNSIKTTTTRLDSYCFHSFRNFKGNTRVTHSSEGLHKRPWHIICFHFPKSYAKQDQIFSLSNRCNSCNF